jgi:hypothetical protein
MRNLSCVAVRLFAVGLLAGCARQSAATLADAGPPTSVHSSPTPASSANAIGAATAPPSTGSPYGLVLADRLNQEAASRPTETPRAEDVLAAIAKNGIPIQDQAQHLGYPIGARFCIGAKSPPSLAMSACEYADVAAAAAGRDASAKAFVTVEHRDIVVNKKTTLTILQSPFDAQSQIAHDKAVAAFKKM